MSELERLLTISRSFKFAKALNLAGKLDVFTHIHNQLDGATLASVASTHGFCQTPLFRGTADFLDLLVSMSCLQREGMGPEARYFVHPACVPYLVRGQPEYVGGLLALNSDRSYVLWEYLEQALKEGQVPPRCAERVPNVIDVFGADETAAKAFADGMTGASIGNFTQLAHAFDFTCFKSLGDFGGSCGCLCVAVCQHHPHMTACTYDLPPVHQAADEYVSKHGMSDKVQVCDFDFFSDEPFPEHDVITMGMVLHDWGTEKKMMLIRKAYAALRPGGAFIAIDSLIDDDRRSTSFSLAQSLNMLLEFGKENSYDYSFKEFTEWVLQVGFQRTSMIPLVGSTCAAIAWKPVGDA